MNGSPGACSASGGEYIDVVLCMSLPMSASSACMRSTMSLTNELVCASLWAPGVGAGAGAAATAVELSGTA